MENLVGDNTKPSGASVQAKGFQTVAMAYMPHEWTKIDMVDRAWR